MVYREGVTGAVYCREEWRVYEARSYRVGGSKRKDKSQVAGGCGVGRGALDPFVVVLVSFYCSW